MRRHGLEVGSGLLFLDIVVVMLKARSPVTLWARGLIRREVSFFQDYKDHFHCVSYTPACRRVYGIRFRSLFRTAVFRYTWGLYHAKS
jgi:hypothetical protein